MTIKYRTIQEWKRDQEHKKNLSFYTDVQILSRLNSQFIRSKKHLNVLKGCLAFWVIFTLVVHYAKHESWIVSSLMGGFFLLILLLICLKHYLQWNHQVKWLVRNCGYTHDQAKDEAWETTLLGGYCYWN